MTIRGNELGNGEDRNRRISRKGATRGSIPADHYCLVPWTFQPVPACRDRIVVKLGVKGSSVRIRPSRQKKVRHPCASLGDVTLLGVSFIGFGVAVIGFGVAVIGVGVALAAAWRSSGVRLPP
ncbi:hypothetical protein FHG89_03540 [Micromonospora orduensis]|uniref:Uncharacterized protein n=1 Tax=Micromonospora orduensis TaxID=1420891 RepID=A0A5C4QZI4_9ACTN|nr:hypothetical protein [Micromonospora orduensis]TNH31183.1 hypothetical protein FHG89_03540 [Micromonospora orduensis]